MFNVEKTLNRVILTAAEKLDCSSTQGDDGKTLDLGNLSIWRIASEFLELIHRIRSSNGDSFTAFAKGTPWYRHLPHHLRCNNALEDLLVDANRELFSASMNSSYRVDSLVEFTTEIISAMTQAEAWSIRDARHKKSRIQQQEAAQA